MSNSNGYYCGLLGDGLITLLVFVITLPTYIIPILLDKNLMK